MQPTDFKTGEFIQEVMPYKKYLSLIIIFSLIIRGFLAYFLELGNDEVYYWTYALFPDLSHFDHPPMVGFLIQLTTLNLWLDHEFFIRLGAVLLGGINTLLIFHITRRISGSQAGIYAALLYNASVYCFVLCGIFILPDTPQVTFWLLSLLIMVTILPAKEIQKKDGWLMLLLGVTIGLGMLSKYTTVFLWAATGFYILFYNRTWLNKWQLYLAVLLSIIIFSPVIFWNYQHNFISFTFHGGRVSLFESGFRPDYFFTELGGQILYNNPVNFIIIIIVLIALARKKFSTDDEIKRILLLSSLPLIGIFLFVALFRQTLPHWSGPGYLALIVLSGIFFAEKHKNMPVFFPGLIKTSILVLVLGLSVAVAEIKLGLTGQPTTDDPRRLGRNDVTLDMSGWRSFSTAFNKLRNEDIASGNMPSSAPIIITRWFPGAHLDYYVARLTGQKVIAIGQLNNLHKYAWINRERPGLYPMADAYYITSSRSFRDPTGELSPFFSHIEEPEIVRGFKGKKHVQNFFVYRLRNCIASPNDILSEYGIK